MTRYPLVPSENWRLFCRRDGIGFILLILHEELQKVILTEYILHLLSEPKDDVMARSCHHNSP